MTQQRSACQNLGSCAYESVCECERERVAGPSVSVCLCVCLRVCAPWSSSDTAASYDAFAPKRSGMKAEQRDWTEALERDSPQSAAATVWKSSSN